MSEPLPRPAFDRRHPGLPYEELRRRLLEADEDRYRLQNELRALTESPQRRWPKARRRAAIAAGIVIVTSLAGGVAWQMCTSTARAGDRASVRVQTATVVPHIVATERPNEKPAMMKAAARSKAVRGKPVRSVVRVPRVVPRPLSPGEFGRPRVAAY